VELRGLAGQVYPAYHGPHTLTLNIAWFVENSRFAIEEAALAFAGHLEWCLLEPLVVADLGVNVLGVGVEVQVANDFFRL